jgi:hypothetical protein
MDNLQSIVEEIGLVNDSAEASKWQVAQKIADAFAEFPSYHPGLTQGLCHRLRKSSDTIYNMRNAENLRDSLKVDPVLSVSHFVALHELKERYALTDDSIREWVSHALDCSMSCRELRQAVSEAHIMDAKSAWKRKVARVVKLMTTVMLEAEGAGVTEKIYQDTKTAVLVVQDWAVSVGEWG